MDTSVQDNLTQLSKDWGLVGQTRLKSLAEARVDYLVDGLVLCPSVNILAGDSGLGKSPLCVQLALSVATGKPFLGHGVKAPGPVIYCDAEAQPATLWPIAEGISKHIGLPNVPENLLFWNPSWNVDDRSFILVQNKTHLYNIVERAKPALVILDTLRYFFPREVNDPDLTIAMLKEMRRYCGQNKTSWLLVHHLRKKNKDELAAKARPTIRNSAPLWLEEASGTLALINNTDLRLGWEKDADPESEALWMGGLLRTKGEVGPFKVDRRFDDEGDPVGYSLASVHEQFTPKELEIYASLPNEGREFTYTYITQNLGKKDSLAARFIRRACDLGFVKVARTIQNNGKRREVYQKVG